MNDSIHPLDSPCEQSMQMWLRKYNEAIVKVEEEENRYYFWIIIHA